MNIHGDLTPRGEWKTGTHDEDIGIGGQNFKWGLGYGACLCPHWYLISSLILATKFWLFSLQRHLDLTTFEKCYQCNEHKSLGEVHIKS